MKVKSFDRKSPIFVLLLLGWSFAPPAFADGISFTLSGATQTGTSGQNLAFQGTVTNNSGGDLNASDFFFNFFGFDPMALSPNQDVGVSSDFSIPNGTKSLPLELFDVTLGSVPHGPSFTLEALLEDINGDLSTVQVVTILTSGTPPPPPPAAPEPSTLLQLVFALITLAGFREMLPRR